jgi:predicted alpha/beta hydrolase
MGEKQTRAAAARAVNSARDLALVGQLMAGQRSGLGAEIEKAAAAAPWGDPAFARRYATIEQQVLGAWEQLAAYVESLGEAAERSAADALTPAKRRS